MTRRPMHDVLPGVLLALGLIALPGCGSTVQSRTTGSASGQLSASAGSAPLGVPGSDAGPGAAPGSSAGNGFGSVAGGAAPGRGTTPDGDGPGAVTTTPGGPGAPSTGGVRGKLAPGITATEVRFGALVVTAETDAQLSTFGASGSYGDGEGYYRAVVADVNRHGGVLGRRLVAHLRPISIVGDYNAQVEAHCRAFTEDDSVVAAAANSLVTDGWDDCLHKHQTLSLNESAYRSRTDLQRLRGTFVLGSPYIEDEFGASYVRGLSQAGFFTPGSNVGVLYTESPAYRDSASRELKPALAKAGINVAQTFGMSPLQSSGDVGTVTSQAQSAVLQFRSAGVTHVLAVLDHAVGLSSFISNAENQGYRPRYGMTSRFGPGLSAGAAYASRVFAVGTRPNADVTDVRRSAAPQYARCLKVITAAGVATPTPENGLDQALATCDFVWFLKAALEKAATLGYDGLIAGAQALGSSWQSASTLGAELRPGLSAAASVYRPIRLVDSCGCMAYVGGAQSVRSQS